MCTCTHIPTQAWTHEYLFAYLFIYLFIFIFILLSTATFPIIFFYCWADLLLLRAENFYVMWRLHSSFKMFFVICMTRIFTVKTKKFQLHSNNLVCLGAFQLLCSHAPTQLRGNIGQLVTLVYTWNKFCFSIARSTLGISNTWPKSSFYMPSHWFYPNDRMWPSSISKNFFI
jgi:hypothetical protein